MFMRNDGRVSVKANGTSHSLYSGPPIVAGEEARFYRLAIEYDSSNNSVRAWVDDDRAGACRLQPR